jgi:hypothetical protein
MNANAALNVDPYYAYAGVQKSVCVTWGGHNDLSGSASAADVYALIQTYCLARRAVGWKVVVGTTLPRIDPGIETKRLALNTLLRAGWSTFADALADPGADPTIGTVAALSDPVWYRVDQAHLTHAGRVVAAGLFAAAILTV